MLLLVIKGEFALGVRRAERRRKRLESKQERLGEPVDERYMEANSGHTQERKVSVIYFNSIYIKLLLKLGQMC